MGIEVLGPVRLSTDAGVPVAVPERKVRLLLAALVAAGGRAVPADALIERVWGDRLPAHPERVLRAKLSVLRAALDEAVPGLRDRLAHGPAGYALDVDRDLVDADRFTAAVTRARRVPSAAGRAEALGQALSSWRGRAYDDVADELWLGPVIESLHEARMSAVEQRAEALLVAGDTSLALEVVHAEAAEHPLRERLVGAQVLALYRLGRQAEALAVYESLRRRLAEKMGADPTPALRELHARVLRQDPALSIHAEDEPFHRRGNLPAATAPLIGRGPQTGQVADLLAGNRLVTLTGVGGVGKTRLALHVAHTLADRFDRGSWWIDLTQLGPRDTEARPDLGDRVTQLVVAALGLPEDGDPAGSAGRLARALRGKDTLLVLDNAEHVVAEAAAFAGELLNRVSGVRLLITSRQAFSLPSEQRFEVTALSTQTGDGLSEAAAFFIARARATDSGLDPAGAEVGVVEELVRRLDGLPLALELAASRVRGLSIDDLLVRLTDRLNLLARPVHGVPRRQQTLRGMVDWSWSLLDERERAVLRRLAVHPGSWSLAAVEAVCADGEPTFGSAGIEQGEVVDVLIGLVDRSMVATVSARDGGLRYRLLESIGLYAAERLVEAGERDAVARRHVDYFRDLAEREDARLRGPEQRQALAVLAVEHAHIDRAFREALDGDDEAGAVAIMAAVFWYRWIIGRRTRLRDDLAAATKGVAPGAGSYATAVTLEACLRLDDHPGAEEATIRSALALFGSDELARARVQWFAATSLMATGTGKAGAALSDEAIDVLHEHGDTWHLVAATCERNWFLVTSGAGSARSLPDGRAPVEAARAIGDRYLEAQAVGVLQRIAEHAGDHERAAALAEDALRICRSLGFHSEGAWWAVCTAIGAIRRGDADRAQARLATARAMSAEVGDQDGQVHADYAEAILARSTGDTGRARVLLDSWRQATGSIGDPSVQIEHAYLAIEENDLDAAEQVVRELVTVVATGERPQLTGRWLELGSALRLAQHDEHAAAWLLGTADAHRDRTGSARDAVEQADATRLRRHLHARQNGSASEDRYRAGQMGHPDEAFASFAS